MPKTLRNVPIRTWESGDIVQGFALLAKKELRQDRNGKSFLDLELADASGSIVAKVWSDSPALNGRFEAHQFVAFRGSVKSYRDQLQLTIDDCREATDGDRRYGFDESQLIPSTREDLDVLWARLERTSTERRAAAAAPARRGDPRRPRQRPARAPGGQVDPPRLPRRPARARGLDGRAGGARSAATTASSTATCCCSACSSTTSASSASWAPCPPTTTPCEGRLDRPHRASAATCCASAAPRSRTSPPTCSCSSSTSCSRTRGRASTPRRSSR